MGALAVLLIVLSLLRVVGQQPSSTVAYTKERDVKSAFLFNFLKYVEWPAPSNPVTNGPVVVGISETDPIMPHLLKVARGRTIDGRPLEVRSLSGWEQAGEVHVLWVGSCQAKHQADWLQAAAGKNVLTVGETEFFAKKGGIITFVIEHHKVRFDINMKAARSNGIVVRAQLQKLARKLHRADE